jgi:hypothetical protein
VGIVYSMLQSMGPRVAPNGSRPACMSWPTHARRP